MEGKGEEAEADVDGSEGEEDCVSLWEPLVYSRWDAAVEDGGEKRE